MIFGNILLNEVLSGLQWLGVTITIVSIYLINQRDILNKKSDREVVETVQPSVEISEKKLKPLKIALKESEPEI